MKPYGSNCEFESARKADLLRVYNHLIRKANHIFLGDIYKELVRQPSIRFWVSEERAAIVLSIMFKGGKLDKMRTPKRQMYQEIYRRAVKLKAKQPSLSFLDLAIIIVHQPAPHFYLSPGSAKVLICTAKKELKEERRKQISTKHKPA